MKYLVMSLFFMSIVSCDKGAKTPEGLIKMFVKDLSSKSIDKNYFEKFTTDKLWNSVKDLTDKEFDKFANSKKVKNPRLEIISKNCVSKSCTLTYVVSYMLGGGAKSEFASEVKKVAIVIKDGDVWKIAEVSNIKTYLEAKSPIEIGPKTNE